jgi:hypothetical protein
MIDENFFGTRHRTLIHPGKRGFLALEDGSFYEGISIGAEGERDGEVVFNTSMTGYQEILTDPSYRGQIVTMTYPMIGNVGINSEDVESSKPQVSGFVVRENSRIFSNFRSQGSLSEYLIRHQIVAIEGIDTRALVRRIRDRGAQKGIISSVDSDRDSLVEKARKSPGLVGRDLVREVVPSERRNWQEGLHSLMSQANAQNGERLRHEVEHPPSFVRSRQSRYDLAGDGFGARGPGSGSRRRLSEQRAGRPGAVGVCDCDDPRLAGEEAGFRDLPGASTALPGQWREDLQIEIRPSRRKPTGFALSNRAGRNYLSKSRFRGR